MCWQDFCRLGKQPADCRDSPPSQISLRLCFIRETCASNQSRQPPPFLCIISSRWELEHARLLRYIVNTRRLFWDTAFWMAGCHRAGQANPLCSPERHSRYSLVASFEMPGKPTHPHHHHHCHLFYSFCVGSSIRLRVCSAGAIPVFF